MEEHPKVKFSVVVDGTESMAGKIRSGELDGGVYVPLHTYEGLHFEPLFVEKMALLVPEKSPLAGADAVGAEDLAKNELLSESSCAYRAEMEKVLVGLGANASVDVEVGHAEKGSVAILGEAVRRGLGIAALPEAGMSPPLKGTAVESLRGVELGLTVGILMPSDRAAPSRALERFVHTGRRPWLGPGEREGLSPTTA